MKGFRAVCAFLLTYFIVCSSVYGQACKDPHVISNTYTTTDGTVVSQIGFIAEFTVSCSNNAQNLNLYAEVNGQIMPAVRSSDGNKFQVSWTSEPNDVKSYLYAIKIFDEEGLAALRKAQRTGEDVTAVAPLLTIEVRHPGTYFGPWLQSELMAAGVALAVWYFAFSTKKQMMS